MPSPIMEGPDCVRVLSDVLRIPKAYIKSSKWWDRAWLVAHSDWLRSISNSWDFEKCPFHLHDQLGEDEVRSAVLHGGAKSLGPKWQNFLVRAVSREPNEQVIPLPRAARVSNASEDQELLLGQLLHYVARTNYRNLWKMAYKKYSGCYNFENRSRPAVIGLSDKDSVLHELMQRIFASPCSLNTTKPLAFIWLKSTVLLIIEHPGQFTLDDLVTYSPAALTESSTRPMLLLRQLLTAIRDLHNRGAVLGTITLADIYLTEGLYLRVLPNLEDNFFKPPQIASVTPSPINNPPNYPSTTPHLAKLVEDWARGKVSNLDYLLALNEAAGRRFGDPKCHYIIPWVTDLSNCNGLNWRDLTKSKFRLTKGDRQLDLTYEADGVPHHVSEALSDITYYVYMSRRTPRSVLCQHVRPRWEPQEYPTSIERLYAWTPDECIPEFYTDPSVFETIHEDLPDLAIPNWATNASDLVAKHREALESPHVSERLHHWIDLTFGYKLSGSAAVKSKNVCLQLVDSHTSPRDTGVVQLFQHPHPSRWTPSPHWGRVPPNDILDWNPAAALGAVESLYGFISRTFQCIPEPNTLDYSNVTDGTIPSSSGVYKQVVASKRIQDMQVLGCLIVELFLSNKLRPHFNSRRPDFSTRLTACRKACSLWADTLPRWARSTAALLLQGEGTPPRYHTVSSQGLPPPSAHQLLQPLLGSSLLPFPRYLTKLCATLRDGIRGGETRVRAIARELVPLLPTMTEEGLNLLLPHIRALLEDRKRLNFNTDDNNEEEETAVHAAWHLLEPFAHALGPRAATSGLLEPLVKLYETERSAKLLHRSFLLKIQVRFGLQVFLENLAGPLVEAAGSGNLARAEMAADSLVWLGHRLGPVLASKYLARNLLRMLALCYTGFESLHFEKDLEDPEMKSLVAGDHRAGHVLYVLDNLAALYGEQLVVLQYLTHAAELGAQCCKRRITATLEGGLVGCLVLIAHCLPHLSDATLVDVLPELIARGVLEPALHLAAAPQQTPPSGQVAKNALLAKCIYALKLLTTRVGPEISELHLHWLIGVYGREQPEALEALVELRNAFLPEAPSIPFAEIEDDISLKLGCETGVDHGSFGANVAVIGNRIDIADECISSSPRTPGSLGSGIAVAANIGSSFNTPVAEERHLRGNWLAYWEHEVGRADKEPPRFTFKQIRLQGFHGHSAAIRTISCLDNENSFLTASKDRTVKLWSLRSEGDGTSSHGCRWTYSGHRKALIGAVFVESRRLVASCDTAVHLWDPFLGSLVGVAEGRGALVAAVSALPAPSPLVIAATADCTLRLLDARLCTYVNELKLSASPGGIVRCVTAAPSGLWIAAGLGSGIIVVLDARTGIILASWKAHEGELLQLIAADDNTLISSSLDQAISAWNPNEGRLLFQLPGPTEPAHCLCSHNSELITGTTANRIGVHTSLSPEASFSSTRLRTDAFRGVLTSMTVLPLNQLLLLGADSGALVLLC